MILVGDGTVHIALEEGKHGEPDARPATVLVSTSVSQGVIVEEETRGDVEGDEHIDGVVFMGCKDEENPKKVQHPGDGVNQIPVSWRVFSHKKVEHCYNNSVSTEHVVSAGLDSCESHPETSPNCQRSLYLSPGIAVCLAGTF